MTEYGDNGSGGSAGSPDPGWYPDPGGSGGQRWWTGAAWTDATTPPAGYTEQQAPAPDRGPRPRNRRYVVGGIVAAAAIVAGIVVAVTAGGGDEDSGRPAASGSGQAATASYKTPITELKATYTAGATYGFTPTLANVPQDFQFDFEMDFDFDKVTAELTKQRAAREKKPLPSEPDPFTAVAVYSDPALTVDASVLIETYENSRKVSIVPAEDTTAQHDAAGPEVRLRSGPELGWGLHHDYYIVRSVAADTGKVLAKPVVTKFSVRNLMPSPVVSTSSDDYGYVSLHWNKVPGATKYIVVAASQRFNEHGITDVNVIAQTSATSFTEPDKPKHGEPGDSQNDDFGISLDSQDSDPKQWALEPVTHQFGVIATDGKRFSGYVSHDTSAELGSLPNEQATNAQEKAFPLGEYLDSWAQLPTTFPYTALSGATLSGVPQIDVESLEADSCDNCYDFYLEAQGTDLYEYKGVTWGGDLASIRKAAAAYNARVAARYTKTGTPAFDYAQPATSGSQYDLNHPSTTAPKVAYPVYGSTPYVKFLAANMIAGKAAINAGAFSDKPGAPSIGTAVREAVEQNPYVLGYLGFASTGPGTVTVSYGYSQSQAESLRKRLQSKIRSVVAKVRTAGSAAEKVRAINANLTAGASYDYAAYNAAKRGKGYNGKYLTAQDATGVLLLGRGVCNSYARAFDAVAKAAGLESVVVTGDITSSGERHAWNKVKVDGRWKAVDVTWNDSPQGNRYLLIRDSGFTGPAKRSEDSFWVDPAYAKSYTTS